MELPQPDPQRLTRRAELLRHLGRVLGNDQIIERPEDRVAYECDALSAYRQIPMAVVLPATTKQVADAVRVCGEIDIPIVPWGAGTGLSGGALALADGIVLSIARMNRVLDVDLTNRTVTVEAGGTNLAVSEAVRDHGFYYAPDPSSQLACTIGGNIAENSGGVHCLKYGTTTNNVLGIKAVFPDGEVVDLGGKSMEHSGYDLLALMTGSEGLLGIITQATLRILPKPEIARAHIVLLNEVMPYMVHILKFAAEMVPLSNKVMGMANKGSSHLGNVSKNLRNINNTAEMAVVPSMAPNALLNLRDIAQFF